MSVLKRSSSIISADYVASRAFNLHKDPKWMEMDDAMHQFINTPDVRGYVFFVVSLGSDSSFLRMLSLADSSACQADRDELFKIEYNVQSKASSFRSAVVIGGSRHR